jgi:hypothetical protein
MTREKQSRYAYTITSRLFKVHEFLCHMKRVVCAKEFTTAKILNLPKGIGPSQKISQSHKVLFVLYIAII